MDIPRIKQKIGQMYREQRKMMDVLLSTHPFVKGTVYLLARRCGKPNCRCKRENKLHKTHVLTYKSEGKSQLEYLRGKGEDIEVLEKLVWQWKRFRSQRASFAKHHRKIMALLFKIEQQMEKEGKKRRRKYGPGSI